jgi:branched-chain amino acid transport system substrate-binding protein
MNARNPLRLSAAIMLTIVFFTTHAGAENKCDPDGTDSEIKIGNIMPYTGLFSEYGAIGRAEAAYFRMINDRGGVSGRKINFVSADSGYSVKQSVGLAHRLVEQDQVLLLVGTWGTDPNMAIRTHLNEKRVPHLFISSGAATFNDPSHFPWTMGFQATFLTEGSVYARYILSKKPDAKIGLLYADAEDGRE